MLTQCEIVKPNTQSYLFFSWLHNSIKMYISQQWIFAFGCIAWVCNDSPTSGVSEVEEPYHNFIVSKILNHAKN